MMMNGFSRFELRLVESASLDTIVPSSVILSRLYGAHASSISGYSLLGIRDTLRWLGLTQWLQYIRPRRRQCNETDG